MPLKSIVKVSHLSNLSDARYCSGMGVELLGFAVIPGTQHYMTPQVFQDIRGWISGPKIIAELYGIASRGEIQTVLQTYAPDYFELTWEEYQAFGKDLTLPCIVSLSGAADAKSIQKSERIAYLLVDEDASCDDLPLITIPALVKTRSLEMLKQKQAAGCFYGYVLDGPKEVRPGVTNYEQLGVILEALESD